MINGILVLDKPRGFTSTQAVNRVKKFLNVKKAGHVGTLDPVATGVLPVCLNKATRVIPFLDDSFKEYITTMELGIVTDTMDKTGNIIQKKDIGKINKSDILQIFKKFTGIIEQIPPMYSAIKKNGVRLYELARKGIEVDRKPRTVHVRKLELIDYEHPLVSFKIDCSKGTYVRVICSDIGEELGCGARMNELRRLKCCNFDISESYEIDELAKGNFKIIDMDGSLRNLRSFEVNSDLAKDIRYGKPLSKSMLNKMNYDHFSNGEFIKLKHCNQLVSVVESLVSSQKLHDYNENDKVFKINRVFN